MYPTPDPLWQTFKPDNDYPPIFSLEYPLKILRFWGALWNFDGYLATKILLMMSVSYKRSCSL